ncbi:MAG: UvrD-helicase domain-containing protein [Thermodesulfovibrionales bacterium]|nr:UvrD-helicase domain-containing protein [Thermodesulfovibrionales bacterium]
MNSYLDTQKSVIISSPAGSGKTEKLARRYISLLLDGSEIEKILCITFTEKAAAEMKERIFNILERENPDLFLMIKEKMPLMRISTIHAFCLKLLKRFSIELGVDPSLDVMDEFEASLLWSEAVYECVMEEKDKPALFFDMMKDRGIKGWDKVFSILNTLYAKRPISELLLKSTENENNPPSPLRKSPHPHFAKGGQGGIGEEKRILELYSKCLEQYKNKKLERHLLDFDDLEIMTYEALSSHPEWQNILYSFDEHTDHILVDEFQDTNSIQWQIIDKLTEEWRSGIGSKRSKGKTPTIFLVGDDKQSIYLFRGANAGVFEEAKNRLSEWLGNEYHFEEAKENFRSLPAIINFANALFEKLMPPALHETWRTRYAHFEATRKGEGRVELALAEAGDNIKKSRIKEASVLAKRIRSLAGIYKISDGDKKRPCAFGDMAVLLRKRTHLALFESALRKEHIPFIVVKGIGFYDEPEVALLRELLSFIIDPHDDYSLFCALRSPLFGIDYETLLNLIAENNQPLINKLQANPEHLGRIFRMLHNWIEKSKNTPLAIILEEALTETEGWKHYREKQRQANIKKFIKLIESYESAGFSGLEIREKLIKARDGDEPKANINTEGMNAVKIMTIHAAKGLQFPMVFLPSLDEADTPRSSSIVIDEEGSRISIAYEEDSAKRKNIAEFARRKEKELEEGKRLFYVAVTRARDFLCMLGALNKEKSPAGRLAYLTENFDILKNGKINSRTDFFEILTETEIDRVYSDSLPSPVISHSPRLTAQEHVFTEPLPFTADVKWRDVTEDLDIRITHGEEWVILGRIFHRLFEELSKGILMPEGVNERTLSLLKNEFLSDEDIQKLSGIVLTDFQSLKINGHLDNIILPRENSFSELPFILQKGNTVFRGRIDRVIIENNIASVYDYKTFPVKDEDLPLLSEKYRFQMDIYKEAAGKILSLKTKAYLLFTHRGLLAEM